MNERLLYVDAAINIVPGLVLTLYLRSVFRLPGIPEVRKPFCAGILAAVLFGIGLALLMQIRKTGTGLGLPLRSTCVVESVWRGALSSTISLRHCGGG